MVLKKDAISFIKVILFGIVAGSLCAIMDLFPPDFWTFSSFSGSLGFWAVTGMIVLMQSDSWILAAINTFLYFGVMNTSFFFVHLLLPFEFPRFTGIDNAAMQSLVWLIPSFICGIFAIVAYQAKRNDKWGVLALSLPLGLLLFEDISVLCSVFVNHKYLFQTLVDAAGFVLLLFLYKDQKKSAHVLLTSASIGAILLLGQYILYGNILYY